MRPTTFDSIMTQLEYLFISESGRSGWVSKELEKLAKEIPLAKDFQCYSLAIFPTIVTRFNNIVGSKALYIDIAK